MKSSAKQLDTENALDSTDDRAASNNKRTEINEKNK